MTSSGRSDRLPDEYFLTIKISIGCFDSQLPKVEKQVFVLPRYNWQ
jgi:hypothetical protein